MQSSELVERITDQLESLGCEIHDTAAIVTALSASCGDGGSSPGTMRDALDGVYHLLIRIRNDVDKIVDETIAFKTESNV